MRGVFLLAKKDGHPAEAAPVGERVQQAGLHTRTKLLAALRHLAGEDR